MWLFSNCLNSKSSTDVFGLDCRRRISKIGTVQILQLSISTDFTAFDGNCMARHKKKKEKKKKKKVKKRKEKRKTSLDVGEHKQGRIG